MYDKILARSFSKHEQKQMGYWATFACLMFVVSLCTVFKPYLGPLPVLNLRLSVDGKGLKMLMLKDAGRSIQARGYGSIEFKTNGTEDFCNFSEPRSDICKIKGDIRVHGNSSTIYLVSSQVESLKVNISSWRIRPYARKVDESAMKDVREWSVQSVVGGQEIPQCTVNHSVPAIVFSTGGYSGNYFHDFSDIIIPLYVTSRKFDGEVKFLVTNKTSWWANKFQGIVKKLSNYETIDIDREDGIHCFASVIVGLTSHRELGIDPLETPYSMKDFREFLRDAYSLNRTNALKLQKGEDKRPRLLMISRRNSRKFTNNRAIRELATSLGYEVVVTEAMIGTNLSEFAQVVNSCDVLMGVHGAGLTNLVFLPENAVLIQIVPLGRLEWLSRRYFGEPAKDMNIKYLEYQINQEESTLIKQYPSDDLVFQDPYAVQKQGWLAFRSVYLDKQNVNVDVNRFRSTLLKALELLRQ